MEKTLFKIVITLGLFFNTSLFAISPQEYEDITNSFKLKDTSDLELSQTFTINGQIIKLQLEKQEDSKEKQNIQHIIFINGNHKGGENSWGGIFKFDQRLFAVACISKDEKTFLSSVVRSSFKRKKKIHFAALVSQLDESSPTSGSRSLGKGPLKGISSYFKLPLNNPKKYYAYYNENKMLNQLYKSATCDKIETQKANIKVLVNGKWVIQEDSWK